MRLRTILATLLILTATTACAPPSPPTPPSPAASATPEPTTTLSPTHTPVPTTTPTPTSTPTPTPTATPTPLPETVLLEPMNHQQQTFNNCGPASVAILLGYYGHWITQHQVNEQIKPRPSMFEMMDYMPQHQLMARMYQGPPSRNPIRLLLANDIPVIILQRLEPGSSSGHYRVVQGYDDVSREFISDDPLLGPDFRIDYDTFTKLSGKFAPFIAVYPPEMDPLVHSLMRDLGMHEITSPFEIGHF